MACPIPIRIINPRYKKIASLSDNPTELKSYEGRDDYYIDVPCGHCYHCKKSYKTQWNLRLQHHFKYLSKTQKDNSYFITLTFSDEYLPSTYPKKSDIAPLVRKFLERIRKKYKKSVTHWICSEYGDTTQRYHLHGILFDCPFPIYELSKYWKYGYTSSRKLSQRRITYVTTYVNKQLKGLVELPHLKQHIFTSPAIGKAFTQDPLNISYSRQHGTVVPFIFHNNRPFAMPRYYRKHMFTDDERENLTESYFHFLSDDVIPPPPYFIGVRKYTDYTLFLADAKRLKSYYNTIYKPFKSSFNYGKSESKPDF